MLMLVLVVGVFWLAYSNGANDNFKGVATLYGGGTASFRRALIWASAATVAGSVVSVMVAGALTAVFQGKGILPDALAGTPPVLAAIAAAAGATIFLATWLGMPTSTTHALMGALVGVAVVGSGGGVRWGSIAQRFALPLLLTPVIAVVVAAASYWMLRRTRSALGVTRQTCLCVGNAAPEPVQVQHDGSVVLASSGLSVRADEVEKCVERYDGRFVGVDAQGAVDVVHYASAAAVCFGRAVNDTPKIAALLLAARAINVHWGLAWVAAAMAIGGLLNSRRVAETMSKRITDMSPGQGLAANLATAFLVLVASRFGMPVSTTHVSCGSIFGIGVVNRRCHWKTVLEVGAAWLSTLPVAALLGGLFFLAARRLF